MDRLINNENNLPTGNNTLAVVCCPQAEFECVNSKKKQKKKGYKNSGVVSVKLCQV